jgi:hypothetical protein
MVSPSDDNAGCAATSESGSISELTGSLQLSPVRFEYIITHPFFSRLPASQRVKYTSLKSGEKHGVPSSESLLRFSTGTGVLHFDFLSSRLSKMSVKLCPVAPCVLFPAASSREDVK